MFKGANAESISLQNPVHSDANTYILSFVGMARSTFNGNELVMILILETSVGSAVDDVLEDNCDNVECFELVVCLELFVADVTTDAPDFAEVIASTMIFV